jgi:hypothetical protein
VTRAWRTLASSLDDVLALGGSNRRLHMSRSTSVVFLSGAFFVTLAGGCAMQQQQVEQGLDRRVDCRTAPGDLRVLESEKANVVQRIAEGATAIYPAGAVMGILMGTEGTKLQVAAGDYNDRIDARIAEIKNTCGL